MLKRTSRQPASANDGIVPRSQDRCISISRPLILSIFVYSTGNAGHLSMRLYKTIGRIPHRLSPSSVQIILAGHARVTHTLHTGTENIQILVRLRDA